jgi:hypothetical protein
MEKQAKLIAAGVLLASIAMALTYFSVKWTVGPPPEPTSTLTADLPSKPGHISSEEDAAESSEESGGSISREDQNRNHRRGFLYDPTELDELRLDRSIDRLKRGNLAYNTPERMKTGQTAHVVARIGSDKLTIALLMSQMPEDKATKTDTATTPISTKMKMTLKSADFEVTPLSSEEQFVAGITPTTWEWDIAPKHSGKLRLHLAAVVELDKLSRDFTSVDRDVAVQVDPVDAVERFVEGNVVWTLGGLGTAIAGLCAWFRKPKKPQAAKTWEIP